MSVVVTGAAGFIGSRLCARLLADGRDVVGIDAFTPFYPRRLKEANVAPLLASRRFRLREQDLNAAPLRRILKGAEAVFHLAAQAGVRGSWGPRFADYLRHNVQATQALLEAAKDARLGALVYASSSSVYGLTPDLPMTETSPLRPVSPYGVTKLAAEDLCLLYASCFGVPAVALRFFTVYGPGQRPDMAFHRFFRAILDGREIPVFGDGRQTRDFTYVDDIVAACVSAERRGRPGEIYNVGGGHRERLDRLWPVFESVTGRPVRIRRLPPQKGDAPHTCASLAKARRELGFRPRTGLRDGLEREWDWIRAIHRSRARRAAAKD